MLTTHEQFSTQWQEIEKYVEQQAPVQHADDPFEGMSPEEIDAYVQKHNVGPAS